MKEKFLSWQGTKRRELYLSCCGFDSYISFEGKKLLSAFGTVQWHNMEILMKSSSLEFFCVKNRWRKYHLYLVCVDVKHFPIYFCKLINLQICEMLPILLTILAPLAESAVPSFGICNTAVRGKDNPLELGTRQVLSIATPRQRIRNSVTGQKKPIMLRPRSQKPSYYIFNTIYTVATQGNK